VGDPRMLESRATKYNMNAKPQPRLKKVLSEKLISVS
jgi:hypothetical protein